MVDNIVFVIFIIKMRKIENQKSVSWGISQTSERTETNKYMFNYI